MAKISRSMRIVFDLQAAQTNSFFRRGVGNYSQGIFEGFVSQYGSADTFALTNRWLPNSLEIQSIKVNRILNIENKPDLLEPGDFEGGNRDALESIYYSSICQSVKPDVIHASHNFLDCHDNVLMPGAIERPTGQLLSTTLYDLIPLLFEDHYLKDPNTRRRYLYQLQRLRRFDLLFAISESTRQDAIRLLGIDPAHIITVHGGISSAFNARIDTAKSNSLIREQYDLRKKILMYTGGDDFRKNISGAIEAFAKIKPSLRQQSSFVIVGKISDDSKAHYLKLAKNWQLEPSNLIFTGFVDESTLVAFYQACDGFIFPSMYEGLGLPVIEAMQCGAPVIGSNNSSIKELIERDDALFETDNVESMVRRIEQTLEDQDYSNSLREYGIKRSQDFSWQKTSSIFHDALHETLEERQKAGTKNAVVGSLPRKRIAMLTPLPPCQSGIADYSADFLPYLSKHFDIDLYVDGYRCSDIQISSVFRIFDVQDFEPVVLNYDAILYEVGNSDFHTHMLSLLEKYPGIVTLHDAYMSGILAHLEFSLNQVEYYQQALLYSHGSAGRRFISPNTDNREDVGIAIDTLPTTKKIIDCAIGLISHSKYNLEIALQHYPEGWLAPYRVIPQLMHYNHPERDSRIQARKDLELPENAFIIATFGHVVWTKRGDLLLKAFLNSSLLNDSNAYLVFVGKPSDDQFGKTLKRDIKKSGSSKRIRITGFASTEDYNKYLQASDVAVQLRTNSRGGTPRSVLDSLANKLPVILNNYASFKDYDDDVVVKISGTICPLELQSKLELLFSDPDVRARYAESAKQYIQAHHDPSECAAAYAHAIHEFIDRDQVNKATSLAGAFRPYITNETSADFADKVIDNVRPHIFRRRSIYVDVSHIAQGDHQTGIQRIVRDVVSALYKTTSLGIEPMAVMLSDGKMVPAIKWLNEQQLTSTHERTVATQEIIKFAPGDLLLMLDSSWDKYDDFYPVFEEARHHGVPIINVIYDLLPINLPECFVEGGPKWFSNWFSKAVAQCDALLCISEATQRDVLNYYQKNAISSPPKVGFWHHGSDFEPCEDAKRTNKLPKALVGQRYLLMVGTIEPRKLHNIALEAMERLWDNNVNLKLCIAGKQGWLVDELIEKIRAHKKLDTQLVFSEAPTDETLQQLYANASGLLFLSKGEGLGLPLIEAARHKIPIICSDIPAFRELATDYATFTKATSSDELNSDINDWIKLAESNKLPDSSRIKVNNCDQSTDALISVLINDLNL